MTPEILRDTNRRIGLGRIETARKLRRCANQTRGYSCRANANTVVAVDATTSAVRELASSICGVANSGSVLQLCRSGGWGLAPARTVRPGMDPTRFSVRDAGAAKLRRSKTPTTALRPSAIALLTLMMTHRAPGSLQTLTKMLEPVWLDPETGTQIILLGQTTGVPRRPSRNSL